MTLSFEPVDGIGEVRSGDDIAALINQNATLQPGDVVVVTSKIVSKAAGLSTSRHKEDLLREQTDRVVARRSETTIVRTHHGLTMAAAGIDASNTTPGTLLPLPADPDGAARKIRQDLSDMSGTQLAVIISDTAGRAWRNGQTDIAIGCAGIVPFESLAGRTDPYGNDLAVTSPAVADEIAGGAELASGKFGGRPVVIVRGINPAWLTFDDGPGATALVRDEDGDLFGLGSREAVIASLQGKSSRGFPLADDVSLADLVALANVDEPHGITTKLNARAVTITVNTDEPALWVAAGELRQRLVALAFAHRLDAQVSVDHVHDL